MAIMAALGVHAMPAALANPATGATATAVIGEQSADAAAHAARIDAVLALIDRTVQFDGVALSPDAKRLAWIAKTASADGRATIAHANGRNAVTVAAIEGCTPTDVAWAPESKRLAILSTCAPSDGNAALGSRLSIVDAGTGGGVRDDIVLQGIAAAPKWSGDGKAILALFVPSATRVPSAAAAASRATGSLALARQEVQSVISVDPDSGDRKTISAPGLYVYEYAQAPEGGRLAYTAASPPGDANWWVAKLYLQPMASGEAPAILFDPATASDMQKGLQITQPRWSLEGDKVGFLYGLMSDHGYSGGEIVSADAGTGRLTVWNKGATNSPAWIDWMPKGTIVSGDIVGGSVELARYSLGERKGRPATRSVVARPDGMMSHNGRWVGATLTANGRFAYIGSSFTRPPELYVGDIGKPDTARAVTAVNANVKPLWGEAVQRHWSSEGRQVQGWLLRPLDFDPAKRHPMIVYVHGGPSGVSLSRWPDGRYDGTALAAFGYSIFYPNPRGSFGGGAAFAEASRRDFGGGDFRDIMAGVDHVLRTDPVDGDRLGLTGWSYGGFVTMLGVTRTDRFKAAVAGAGISNWQSLYGQGLINEIFIPFFGATLYDDPAIYAASSAIYGLKAVRTPTLSLVGERDPQTPAAQSLEFWNGLRTLGVPSDLVIYEDEGHQFVKPDNRRDLLRRSLQWFDVYLNKSGEYVN